MHSLEIRTAHLLEDLNVLATFCSVSRPLDNENPLSGLFDQWEDTVNAITFC